MTLTLPNAYRYHAHSRDSAAVTRSRLLGSRFTATSLAIAFASACASLRGGSGGAECQPPSSTALVPFPPARALALAGNYDLTLVADSGPRTGHTARGIISLIPNDTLHRYYINPLGQGWRRRGDRPLIGWGDLHGDVGLMTAGTPLESRDPTLPGVAFGLDSLRGGLRFMLGSQPMMDGGYNELTVTAADDNRFAGRWQSSLGPTNYRATGFFCAHRRGE
jgi:hypothetical protein